MKIISARVVSHIAERWYSRVPRSCLLLQFESGDIRDQGLRHQGFTDTLQQGKSGRLIVQKVYNLRPSKQISPDEEWNQNRQKLQFMDWVFGP